MYNTLHLCCLLVCSYNTYIISCGYTLTHASVCIWLLVFFMCVCVCVCVCVYVCMYLPIKYVTTVITCLFATHVWHAKAREKIGKHLNIPFVSHHIKCDHSLPLNTLGSAKQRSYRLTTSIVTLLHPHLSPPHTHTYRAFFIKIILRYKWLKLHLFR